MKNMKKIWDKIRDLIKQVDNNLDYDDSEYMKIKNGSDNDLSLKI